ncbi:MAG: phage holin family protein [Lachnospiraceae bacterium]
MKRESALLLQGIMAAFGAYLSAKLGVLFPVLCVLAGAMILDYITGMLASSVEALEHPGDTAYGWTSKKGAKGIIKKVGYMAAIAVAMVVDYVLNIASAELGITIPVTAFFGLLVAVWYLLNELLSIIENAGRMGANVPEWLRKYIAVLRDKIDSKVE